MTFLIRNGTLRKFAEAAAADATIRKADAPPRPLAADVAAENSDALLSSLGGTRFFVDDRAKAIAKYEAAEDYRRQVAKADAERDAGFAAKPFVLPSEERRRKEAAAASKPVPFTTAPATSAASDMQSIASDMQAINKSLTSGVQTLRKSLEAGRAEFEAAMKRAKGAVPPPDDEDDGGESGAPATAVLESPPKAKPGTSNLVHEEHPDSVHARRDGRTITSTHAINRKIGKGDAPARVAFRKVEVDGSPSIDLSRLYVVPRV